jgi:pimeloyl-ACP methyl ester carboxylesterase
MKDAFSYSRALWLAIFLAVLPLTCVATEPPGTPEPRGKLVDIGGYRLNLYSIGAGHPSVVLIAGAGDFSFDWSLVQDRISTFTRVCSYDRAGLARSDPGPTPRTMRQDAYELHLLLQKAGIPGPYILVGHSIGGLIARVFAEHYPNDVAGMVLVDPTHEDTQLNYQGKIVRVRESASGKSIPATQTMQTSPPKPPTADDIKQQEFNRQVFGAPKISPPFDKLPAEIQKLRLWALDNPKLSAAGEDFWADELQAMYLARRENPQPLGEIPMIVLVAGKTEDISAPNGISPEEWSRFWQEKKRQKADLIQLSRNSKLVMDDKSGHHIQLEDPDAVVAAIHEVVEAVRQHKNLVNDPSK